LNERFGIRDTRTKQYKKTEREADFVITSKQLDATLHVDYEAPSDHAALIVDI
jgi:galactitol-specific phosphotransferase system IIB component